MIKIKCKDCKYWIEAEGFARDEDVGGCTFSIDGEDNYYPMFLDEDCILKEPYKTWVLKEQDKE